MELTIAQYQKIQKRLSTIAVAFPDVDLIDLERLDSLVGINKKLQQLVSETLFQQLDTDAAGSRLRLFANLCLEHNWRYLAEAFIAYCLDNNIVTDIKQQFGLIITLSKLLVQHGLSTYIEADKQSDQIRFTYQSSEINFSISSLPSEEKLNVLKLLRNKYVSLLLQSTPAAQSDYQALLIDKHDRVTSMIRKIDRGILEESRWARLYVIENLQFGTNTSKALFQDIPEDPFWFDEALFLNFHIMLFPAMGLVELQPGRVKIINEGTGCVKDPQLEVRIGEKIVVNVVSHGVVQASKPCLFLLNKTHLSEISSTLANHQQISLHLLFSKFGNTFRLARTLVANDVLDQLIPQEPDVELLAKKIGVSSERIKSLIDRKISTETDLFNAVKDIFIQIRHIVEQQEGYKQLTNDDNGVRKPRSEDEIQISLRHWLDPMCKALNIDLAREPKSGRGFIDFTFSIGSDLKCLVEVKPSYSARLEHGIKIQLPTYLQAEQNYYGIYVPVMFDASAYNDQIKSIKEESETIKKTHGFEIKILDIKAWKPDSASKTDQLDKRSRYS
jgi:hypothetical protein